MSADMTLSELRKELAGRDGLISRACAALGLDATPANAARELTKFCERAERQRRNANRDTQPIEVTP